MGRVVNPSTLLRIYALTIKQGADERSLKVFFGFLTRNFKHETRNPSQPQRPQRLFVVYPFLLPKLYSKAHLTERGIYITLLKN